MSEEITGICGECNATYKYVLKPGFPRKYCSNCSAKKKADYEAKMNPVSNNEDMQKPVTYTEKPVEVVKPGVMPDKFMSKEEHTHLNCKIMCAKDIFEVLRSENKNQAENYTMKSAIDLVKQAKEAFE